MGQEKRNKQTISFVLDFCRLMFGTNKFRIIFLYFVPNFPHNSVLLRKNLAQWKGKKTRANTAQTMAYSEIFRLSRLLKTVKKVTDSQDSCRLLRQLQNLKTVADPQVSFKLSRQSHTSESPH